MQLQIITNSASQVYAFAECTVVMVCGMWITDISNPRYLPSHIQTSHATFLLCDNLLMSSDSVNSSYMSATRLMCCGQAQRSSIDNAI